MLMTRSAPAADAGKLVAVHNGGGRVVWAADFGRHPDGIHTKATVQLLPWRSSHDVQHAPEVMLAGREMEFRIYHPLDGVSRLHIRPGIWILRIELSLAVSWHLVPGVHA
jgi:hypothetical protein